ncbi:MAG: hypothetical protein EPN91_05650 [Salinibacterium sp.]|nr:MAG: hypothetical protein EPN91_05650 [Salinibacterium sp.]
MHIPPEKLLPQDLVDVFDHGHADEPNDPAVRIRMHVVDAKHAMEVEPSRYRLDLAKPVKAEPEVEPDHEDEDETDV